MHATSPTTPGAPPETHRPPARHRIRVPAVLLVAAAATLAACSTTSATSPSTTAGGGATSAPAGSSTPVIAVATRAKVGTVLVAANGHTLYRLTTDTPTSTTCTGACEQIWPALTVPAGSIPRAVAGLSGPIGTLTRPDGTLQVTYRGHPLYTYSLDTTTSDALGQGVEGVWFTVGAPDSSAGVPTTSTTTAAGSAGAGY